MWWLEGLVRQWLVSRAAAGERQRANQAPEHMIRKRRGSRSKWREDCRVQGRSDFDESVEMSEDAEQGNAAGEHGQLAQPDAWDHKADLDHQPERPKSAPSLKALSGTLQGKQNHAFR